MQTLQQNKTMTAGAGGEACSSAAATPVVSVVIPVYNVEAWLPYTLDSLVAQSFDNWECVCVDDGSRDGSAEVVRSYAARDARIRLVSQPNAGAAAARNHGLEEARGEYILFVDSDDLVTPGLMEACVERLRADGSDLCAYEARAVDAEGRLLEGMRWTVPVPEGERMRVLTPQELPYDVFWMIPVCPWNKMYRADFLRRHGLRFPVGLRRSEDTPFGVLCLALAERISCVKESFYLYRQERAGSQMQTVSHPAVYYCYLDVAAVLWPELRRRGLLQVYGIGALKIIVGNALFYQDFLSAQWRMLVAVHRLRRLSKRCVRELRALKAELPGQHTWEIRNMVETFAARCFARYRPILERQLAWAPFRKALIRKLLKHSSTREP